MTTSALAAALSVKSGLNKRVSLQQAKKQNSPNNTEQVDCATTKAKAYQARAHANHNFKIHIGKRSVFYRPFLLGTQLQDVARAPIEPPSHVGARGAELKLATLISSGVPRFKSAVIGRTVCGARRER